MAASWSEGVKPKGLSNRLQRAAFLRELAAVKQLTVFLDYDGTLVPIENRADLAVLGESQCRVLSKLLGCRSIRPILVSGREREFLTEQFFSLNIGLAAEHGAFFWSVERGEWLSLVPDASSAGLDVARRVFSDWEKHTAGSFVEEKQYCVAWHYRLADAGVVDCKLPQLLDELESAVGSLGVNVLAGKKVIEVRPVGVGKGFFVQWYSRQYPAAREGMFVAIGDDETDEEMFAAVAALGGIALKVGDGPTAAHFRLPGPDDVITLLEELVEAAALGGI